MADQESWATGEQEISADTLSDMEHAAYGIVEDVCRVSGLTLQPIVRARHRPYMDVELLGDDAAVTFGRHGKALDALQYLINLVIQRQTDSDVRILLDAAGYRARRAEALQALAHEFAAQVRERQEECELDPLPPHERRIIHNALMEETGIRTYSEGEEPDRRVIIAPA